MLDLPDDHPPLIIDSFAGGGGASTGIEMALGRSPDIAINHNPAALALHAANHPETLHLSENVWQVDPLDYVRGRHVGLAWFSPDCKHFSKAKGGKPVERNIRDLAWVVVLWAQRARPDVILLENVEEFRDWGPLVETDRGLMPDPEGRGKTFAKWKSELRKCGYKVEWRELRACDYGAPTIRKRLFLVARCDGQKIVWPQPTHGRPDDPDVIAGRKQPWRTAAEIIDWSLPCPSIFDTAEEVFTKHGLRAVRPLATATMSRVARGVDRYVLKSKKPFVVTCDNGEYRGSLGQPELQPVDAEAIAEAVSGMLAPSVIRFNTGATGHDAREPLATVTANSFRKRPGGAAPLGVIAPVLAELGHAETSKNGAKRWGFGSKPVDDPLGTVTASGKSHAVVAPVLSYAQQGGANRSVEDPAHTITASTKDQNAVIAPTLVQTGYGEREGQAPRALDIEAPLGTVVAGGVKHAIAVPSLVGCGGRAGQSRPRGADEPAATITAKADVCVTAAFLAQHNNDSRRDGGVNPGRPAHEPVSTITANPQQGVIAAHLMNMKGSNRAASGAEEPVPTICSSTVHAAVIAPHLMTMRNAQKPFSSPDEPTHTVTAGGAGLTVVAPFISKYYGVEQESGMDEPLHTATGKARFGHVESELTCPPLSDAQLDRARQVAAFLREHGFWDEREFVTIEIEDDLFTMIDIGMRMLTPRELFSAQGFPADYIIDLEYNGKPLPKSDQIACCGNSVSPPMAAALVAANCPQLMRFMEAAE